MTTAIKWGLIIFVVYLIFGQFGGGENRLANSGVPNLSNNIPQLPDLTTPTEFNQTYQSPLLERFQFRYPEFWDIKTTTMTSLKYPNLPTEMVVLTNGKSTLTFHVTPQDFEPCQVNFAAVGERSRVIENVLEYRRPDARSVIYADNSVCTIEQFQTSSIPLAQDSRYEAAVRPKLARFVNPPDTVLYQAGIEATYENPDDLRTIRAVVASLPSPITLTPQSIATSPASVQVEETIPKVQPETPVQNPPESTEPSASKSVVQKTDVTLAKPAEAEPVPEFQPLSEFEEYQNSFFPNFALRYPLSWKLTTDAVPSEIDSLLNRTTLLQRENTTLRFYTSPFESKCLEPQAAICRENILLESTLLAGASPKYRERYPAALEEQFIPFYLTIESNPEADPELLREAERILLTSRFE